MSGAVEAGPAVLDHERRARLDRRTPALDVGQHPEVRGQLGVGDPGADVAAAVVEEAHVRVLREQSGRRLGALGAVPAGGALIALSLWLTVSWAVTPYYYGNDLIYLMAWTPLILAGAPYLSLDSVIRSRRSRRTA